METKHIEIENRISDSLWNTFLRKTCRMYPFRKGRFRVMMFLEGMLERREQLIYDLFDQYKFLLNLNHRDLESTFYFFIPERYEHETQQYIRESVQEGMTTIDVGAHLGLFTLLFANRVGPNGKVYSFEPSSENYRQLKLNVDLNKLCQVIPLHIALSDKSGTSELIINNISNAGHYLKEINAPVEKSQSIADATEGIGTISLDEFVEEQKINKIDLIKIDAERSEVLILEGAKKTLSSDIATRIICEIHSSHKETPAGQDSVRSLFYAYGYRSYILDTALAKKKYLSELKANESVVGLQNLLFLK